MDDWERSNVGGLPIYRAAAFATLPGVAQGFTTRLGGVSKPPYAALNLGSHVEDTAADVQTNRCRLWNALSFAEAEVALAEQVHGRNVVRVSKGGPPVPDADALISDTPHLLLLLFFADCVPIYLIDPVMRAIGLVHAGWRGTAAGIVAGTVQAMQEQFGSQPASCLAAIGPCIGGESYEVGVDVADQFRDKVSVASGDILRLRDAVTQTYSLNLRQVILDQLLCAGLPAENIAICQEDTFCNKRDFFSYRRDGRRTGRMAAYLALT
jgi:YfiH family protein